MLKVLTVFGTRPEAIKLAPVLRELERRADIQSRVCVTGQHREMLAQVLKLFGIVPDHNLDVMREGQTPTQAAAAILGRLEAVLLEERPDWVIVQGDTTTVAAGALASFYAGVRIGHVEAGLRTFNRSQPFPEEINRRIAGVVADLHFAPTQTARTNLLREGIDDSAIYVTGNPVIDALRIIASAPYDPAGGPLHDVPWDKRIILLTAHRRENFGVPFENICLAVRDLASTHPDIHFVFPVHLNPNVQGPARRILGTVEGVTLTPPLDYLPLVFTMRRSYLVLTDSGGIQEEAPGLGKPVLVLRELTERPEAVSAGTVMLVGADRQRIVDAVERLIADDVEYARMATAVNPYGDGNAAPRIVEALLR